MYQSKTSDIAGEAGTRERSAAKIVEGIRRSLDVPFDRVLYALGIRFVGKVVARQLARHFKRLDALRAASLDELLQVAGVGAVIAQGVRSFFANPANAGLVGRRAAAGVQMQLPEEEQLSDSLAGKSIVISGTFARHSREEYKALIEKHGGRNVGSISGKTSFVLAGENTGPSKMEKAAKLGVPLVSETEFLAMIGE